LLTELNELIVGDELIIQKEVSNKGDSLVINYFRDTPCFDCDSYLSVEDGKHHIITDWRGTGTFTKKVIYLDDLIISGKEYFEIWYHEGEIKSRNDRHLLFRLKLE
jgi:hypothetical protein